MPNTKGIESRSIQTEAILLWAPCAIRDFSRRGFRSDDTSELTVIYEELPASLAQLFLVGLEAIQNGPVALVQDLAAESARIAAAGLLATIPRRGLSEAQRRNQANQYS